LALDPRHGAFGPWARAIGPAIGGILLNNALDHVDNNTVQRTFWTASSIMLVAVLVSIYFARIHRGSALALA